MSSLASAIIMGVLQGILEWLPISSEGNLVVFMVAIIGIAPSEALGYAIVLHLGTGLAALIYFRDDVMGIIKRDSETSRILFRHLMVATALTGAIGSPIYLLMGSAGFHGELLLGLMGVALILTGLLQRETQDTGLRGVSSLTMVDSVLLGLVQGLSVIPGVSRSGVTTSVLLFSNFSGEEAFRISFLMSIPASLAAAFGLMLLEGIPLTGYKMVAILAALVVGIASIDSLLKIAQRTSFWKICVCLGVIALTALIPSLV